MLSCFNVDNLMDLIEKKGRTSGKQTMRKKLRSLLTQLLENMPARFSLDLDNPEQELKKQEVSELTNLKTNLEYEGKLSDYGRDLRHVILFNFYLQLCYLLVQKKSSKVLKNMTAFRPIFVNLWFVMLQSFITERAIEIK